MTDAENSESSGPGISVFGGPVDGATLPLSPAQREYRLGSAADCDLQLDLANIDAVHARLTIDGVRLLLSDAGSGTGTYVNGERSGLLQELKDGDRISLGPPGSRGSARLLVRLPEGSFTARLPTVPRKPAGPTSSEASGLAPFSGPGPRDEGPWSLLPADESASGLELSDTALPVLPAFPSPPEPLPDPAWGLELSESTDSLNPSFAPPPAPVPREATAHTVPFGEDGLSPEPSPLFAGFDAPEPVEATELVLGESHHDLALPDLGLPGIFDSPSALPPTPPPVSPMERAELEPALP